jgi:phosphatidylserine decarboxylase
MAKPLPLPVWDRQRGTLLEEWMDDHQPHYESEPQRSFAQWVKSQPIYDRLYALYENSRMSTREIEPLIHKYHIDMAEFEPVRYRSHRRFRPGVRNFPSAPKEMGAFAEARYFGWRNVEPGQKFPVKGHSLIAEQILGSADRARQFAGGPVLLVRLAPVDYHHMHYPDDGTTRDHQRLGRRLWTVNWHALQSKPDILFVNERSVNILETRNFGRLGFVEVGALSVGRIAQVHPLHLPFRRGEEKASFASAARRSLSSVKGASGARPRTCLSTPGIMSRHLCVWGTALRSLARSDSVFPTNSGACALDNHADDD